MDEKQLELADLLQATEVNSSLAQARAQLPGPVPADFDGCCRQCGNEIPARRVELGYTLCIYCSEAVAKRR